MIKGPSTLLSNFPDWDFWTIFWIVAALALTMLSFVAATFRWSQMVHAIGLKEKFNRLFFTFYGRAVYIQLLAHLYRW